MFSNFQEVFATFNQFVTPFRCVPEGSRIYPFIGEKTIRGLFDDPDKGQTVALLALAAAYLNQTEFERMVGETVAKDRIGLQGGHAVAGTSLGKALCEGGLMGLMGLEPPPVRSGGVGWQFDGRRDTEPMVAAVRLGRRYAGCLMKTLVREQMKIESAEEKARLARFSVK